MMIQVPQSFVTQTECNKVAHDHGFRREHGETDGWRHYGSTTVQGSIWLAFEATGRWLLAIDHAGVVAELDLDASDIDGPGLARFRFSTLSEINAIMSRLYELAASLPDAPLQKFLIKTRNMPTTTEAERLSVQRVGQDIFRKSLIEYWKGHCPLTGITDNTLLRASHIKPWNDCETDNERLDVYNGLLLSALWDAAFDRGLVTFGDDGVPEFHTSLSTNARQHLTWTNPLSLSTFQKNYMAYHRAKIFKKNAIDYDEQP